MAEHTVEQKTLRAKARIAGYVLLLIFVGLGASSNGLRITFNDSQTSSSPGELNFWLGHALLLFPASLLLGYGFTRDINALIRRVVDAVLALSARERRLALIALTILVVAAARVGHALFLLELPITDDEYAVEFGGRVLASGHVLTEMVLPRAALPDLFLYFRGNAVGSFDWIGGQAIAAFAHLTGLGPFVWALLAAVPVPALAVLMARRLGVKGGLCAIALFLSSPMALLMSMTTHSQLASRAFLALALLAFWRADRNGGLGLWALVGSWLGLAFLCRPPEIAFFSAPMIGWILYQTWRRTRTYKSALMGLVLGGMAFAGIFLWHSFAMTGNPLLPARFAVPENTDVLSTSLLARFGNNVSYNVFMLTIWFLGPLGLVLVACGLFTDWFTKLLGASIVASLLLAFFHDNPGLHIVGPIHYSESAVPLTIIATHGVANLLIGARRHLFKTRAVTGSIAAALVFGLGTFSARQAFSLRDQARVQRTVYAAIEGAVHDPGGRKAVVFTPWMFTIVHSVPPLGEVGTWVHDWRRPQLDLSDEVLFLRDEPTVEGEVRTQFPDRRFFRIQQDAEAYLVLLPLAGGEPIRLMTLRGVRRDDSPP